MLSHAVPSKRSVYAGIFVGIGLFRVGRYHQPVRKPMLSDVEAKKAKPQDKPYKLTDGKGLYLLVNPNGGKLWRMNYRYEGK